MLGESESAVHWICGAEHHRIEEAGGMQEKERVEEQRGDGGREPWSRAVQSMQACVQLGCAPTRRHLRAVQRAGRGGFCRALSLPLTDDIPDKNQFLDIPYGQVG